jgi:hypothetical protein
LAAVVVIVQRAAAFVVSDFSCDLLHYITPD